MNTIQTTRLLTATLVVGILLLTIPGVAAATTTLTDDFETDLIGQDPTAPWYTFSDPGVNGATYVTTLSGDKVVFNDGDGTNTNAPEAAFTYNTDPCDTTPNIVTMSANFRLETLPAAGQTYEIGFAKSTGFAGATKAVLLIDSAGTIKARTVADDTTTITSGSVGTLTVGAWHTLDLTLRCGNNLAILFSLVVDATLVATADQTGATKEWDGAQGTGNFLFHHGYGGIGFDAYLDDLNTTYQVPTPGLRFCADPSLEPGESESVDYFGYEYVEGVEFNDNPQATFTDIGLADAFEFNGDSGNTEYLGKGFTTGSKAFSTKFRIESAKSVIGEASLFRITYTTGAGGLPDAITKGNGADTGNFANSIQAEFLEVGDDWRLAIYSTIAGTRTQILSSFFHGDPDIATTFNFTVITTTGVGSVIGDQAAAILDGSGNVLMIRSVPAAQQEIILKDQWFTGKGTFASPDAYTYLDDPTDNTDGGDNSTCIYDLIGASVVSGSSGTSDDADTEEPPGGEGGFSELFDPANINAQLFVGFLLVAGMVFMGFNQGGGPAVIGSLFFVGLFLGYSLGWIPLWIILVIFVISLAAVWFLPKPSGDGV